MNNVRLFLMCLFISGCSGNIKMMPRDSGEIYQGELKNCLGGSCDITININGLIYTGTLVKATSNEKVSTGFVNGTAIGSSNSIISLPNHYGQANISQNANVGYSATGTVITDGGTNIVKGLLSSTNGHGLRCEFTATGQGGAGTCIDDEKHIYDALVYR